jgi:hypothetical protein
MTLRAKRKKIVSPANKIQFLITIGVLRLMAVPSIRNDKWLTAFNDEQRVPRSIAACTRRPSSMRPVPGRLLVRGIRAPLARKPLHFLKRDVIRHDQFCFYQSIYYAIKQETRLQARHIFSRSFAGMFPGNTCRGRQSMPVKREACSMAGGRKARISHRARDPR